MVSVLIPTIQKTHLPSLIPDLSKEVHRVGGELIIANNKSVPENIEYLKDFKCTVFNFDQPLSFAESNNHMARYAKNEHILLLNDDTRIKQCLLSKMRETFFLDSKIGIVGCKILTWDGDKIQHAGITFNREGYPLEIRYQTPTHTEADKTKEVQAVTGCCLMTTKTVWKRVGGLNENYINGWEDNDFNLKAREAGYKVWYNGKAIINHRHFGSKDFGRMDHENDNVKLYKKLWVDTGKVFKCV